MLAYHHPHRSSQNRINQNGNDGTTGGVLDEPAPYSLPQPLDENGGGGSNENATKLERDMQLAFEEQEKSSLAPAPSFPRSHHHSAELSHPQIDQDYNRGGTSYGRLEELGWLSTW
jgi:hypothetical protein